MPPKHVRSRSTTSESSSISSKSDEYSQSEKRKSSKQKSERKSKQETKMEKEGEDGDGDIVIALEWNSFDTFSITIIMFISIFTRFWLIQYPKTFIDNEDKQIQYINCYLNGSFFMDSQPPFSTLFTAFIANLLYYRISIKPPYEEKDFTFYNMEYTSLRSISSFFSSLVPPISFFIVRLLGGSSVASLGAALFTLFDFLLIGTARRIGIDGLVQLSASLAVFFSALLRHFHPSSTSWSISVILQSFFAGISFSSHWSCISVVLFVIIFNYLTYHSFRPIPVNIIISCLIFYFCFIAHAIFTPHKSEWNDHLISRGYRADLIPHGDPLHIKHHKIPFRAIELIFLCFRLHRQNSHFVPIHKWIVMGCPWKVLWSDGGRSVALFGNIPVWYGIAFAFIIEALKLILSKRIRENTSIVFVGYLSCLLYLIPKTSERGLEDYQIALLFGIWSLALCIDTEFTPYTSAFIISSLCVAACFVYLIWSPLLYGYELYDARFLPYFADISN